jgi:hypothetical protein
VLNTAKGALTPGGRYFVVCWTLRVFLRLLAASCSAPDAIESNSMIEDLEFRFSPVRDKVRELREYL